MSENLSLKEKAFELIDHLPMDKLQIAIDFLAYLRDREAWEATIELTSDPDIMASLKRSAEDIKQGRTKKWKEIKRNV